MADPSTCRALFEQLIELKPQDRAAELDRLCGDDASLCQQVNQLIDAYESAGSLLDFPLGTKNLMPSTMAKPGDQIGPYELKEQIGEGGFAEVFAAQQLAPVQREVAVKLIKPGMATKEVLARFAVERQALAMMSHPNIARVFDAGVTESGNSYFVMELVRGRPITDFCDQHELTTQLRLELVVAVCEAVQHAHHKGVIHRDIKPSNILVSLEDGRPIPKVIDFGVAKAVDHHPGGGSVLTSFSQMIGTPLYMSPEQANLHEDIDTRSDVYSLGVLLYELLTGTTPLDQTTLKQAAYDDIRRLIAEVDPPKPSSRLSELGDKLAVIAAGRHVERSKLSRIVRGDLDWIVMKALEKNRRRRYQSPTDLAQDLGRFAKHEAVAACPPSAVYRARKFVRKYRAACLFAAASVAVLLGATLFSSATVAWAGRQAIIARKAQLAALAAQQEAENQRDQAETLNQFLLDALRNANPGRQRQQLTMAEVLAGAVDQTKQLGGAFGPRPERKAQLLEAIAAAYRRPGLSEKHEEVLRMARELVSAEDRTWDDDPEPQFVSGHPEPQAQTRAEVRAAAHSSPRTAPE